MKPTSARERVNTVAVLAAGWSAGFAMLHLLWAFGSRLGLGETARAGGWAAGYDALAAVVCLAGVGVALALPPMTSRTDQRARLTRGAAIVLAVVLAARGVAGLVHPAWWALSEARDVTMTAIWGPWFLLGAGLFLVAGLRGRPAGGSL